ncbi:MAG: L-threonylcarbamoyladenylate synthase [Sandaracinaceae bacterium]|nr:L-threonylcarbamoyladenylate synthase [Sandaracinaceae bacterium]MDW8246378.1 L-threonylcarbamoyladenylate synthase [Sandaracinaceae bacterium]
MSHAVNLEQAAQLLARGHVVAIPTETVYGLAADATQPKAILKVFEIKRRPLEHPLIVHLADPEGIFHWSAHLPRFASILIEHFMPGPLTIVTRRPPHVAKEITGGRDSVALRVPAHPLTRALIQRLGELRSLPYPAIAAPSANRFGSVSPTCAAHVHADFHGEDLGVLDGGLCSAGIESTIVDCTKEVPTILRLGAIPQEAIDGVLGMRVPVETHGDVRAPGMLPAHYAPRAKVVVASSLSEFQSLSQKLRESYRFVASIGAPRELSSEFNHSIPWSDDMEANARALYSTLRHLDDLGVEAVLVLLPPLSGLGAAIADRLLRASKA